MLAKTMVLLPVVVVAVSFSFRNLFWGSLWLPLFLGCGVPRASAIFSTSCPTGAQEIELKLNSILESRKVLAPTEGDFREESVRHHVRFYQKSLQERWKSKGLQVVFSSEPVEVSIDTIELSNSTASYEITAVDHANVKSSHSYINQALKAGKLKTGEPVEHIHYTARWKGVACGALPPAEETAYAPFDPYLAFWMVQPSLRRHFEWNGSRFLLSPVFENEYVDYPDPLYSWYVWRPEGKLKDIDGKISEPFHSLKFTENAMEAKVDVHVLQSLPALSIAAIKNRTLKATVIFGIIDENQKVWKPDFPKSGRAKDWHQVEVKLKEFMTQSPALDRGSRYAIDFLLHLESFLEKKSMRFRYHQPVLTIDGKAGQKRLRLRFFFGPTDLLVKTPPEHWAIAKQALEEDDILVYNGHSGLGENFRFENIEQFTVGKLKPRPNQLLAILSCYSFSYNALAARSKNLLLTGSDYTSARGALGLLQNLTGQAKLLPYVEPQDFLILRSLP